MTGSGLLEHLGLGAAHHRQHAVFGTSLAARDRRVDEEAALRLGCGLEFAGYFGAGSGVVDQNSAGLHRGDAAIHAGRHGTQVVVIANAGEDEVGTLAASAGVAAWLPPNSAAHFSDLAAVRL
jgi:hypothetical protein